MLSLTYDEPVPVPFLIHLYLVPSIHRCQRLGLTSLAYLWRRDQEELLKEMIDSQLTAVLIKVASLGKNNINFDHAVYTFGCLLVNILCICCGCMNFILDLLKYVVFRKCKLVFLFTFITYLFFFYISI